MELFNRMPNRSVAAALAGAMLLAGCRPSPPPSEVMIAPAQELATEVRLPDPAHVLIPDTSAAGSVLGRTFTPDGVKVGRTTVTFRQGSGFDQFVEVRIEFRQPELLRPNLDITVQRDARDPPIVSLKSYDPNGSRTVSATFGDDYVMKLVLGPVMNSQLTGQIYLAVPDDQRSLIRGTFNATDVRDDPAAEALGPTDIPCVYGHIKVQGKPAGRVGAEYSGVNSRGVRSWGGVSAPFQPGMRIGDTTFRPRVSQIEVDPNLSVAYHHVTMEPGSYLMTVNWDGRLAGWQWVEVAARSKQRVDFLIDPKATGRLEVSLSPALAGQKVRVVPADNDGRVLVSVTTLASELVFEATPSKGRAQFDKLPAGRYRAYVGSAEAEVWVRPRETANVFVR